MPTYNKLIRDRIPDIIERSGKNFETRILEDGEYVESLKTKLREELAEYLYANNNEEALEEMADILELMNVLAEVHGGSIELVEEIRKEKAEKRGSFKEKIFLVEVED
ncbi:Predicted house-cleaning noncanonical NTP pyrophosphatase, all-alpha NTP-PPase (MazG) superfamily [Thalassobacillus cyri]|uniref:Predicted house-cleaning noncanonical NTP pyrophosphatase, all-alpha NTP-PPase (MazG) superfamily n=1 Tax=Thalassobacillus cyri TaxID=571932 RepID=A0A1H3VZ21_9BACI|nr:nucleoside triphosphate pyrophosphohydrolase [Thalassobacillus cyri]SDZ79931.1 Predicted house-cleaning noncanonical NTP pyrophosphatase, all-alpha NTP-PPase (MazG) superfamily [Thalassobacillus cyri]